jgi:hypothetical protein
MTISSFEFSDRFRDWYLNEVSFSDFNLLVGVSGVGKTQILNALGSIKSAATGNAGRSNGCKWRIKLQSEGSVFVWEAEVSLVPRAPIEEILAEDVGQDSSTKCYFLSERIIRNNHDVLVKRTENDFEFNNTKLPKLKNTESAINLLRDEDAINPLYKAFKNVMFSDVPASAAPYGFVPFDEKRFKSISTKYNSIEALRGATDIPILLKAYILQESFVEEFNQIKQDYRDIFPSVCDIRFGKLSDLDPDSEDYFPMFPSSWLSVGVKEDQVDKWITGPRLSSGMHRTLIHLVELAMAPQSTVIVIDEFENSLGVNCLPDVTNRLMERSRDLQFIVTSHHPYIINNVPTTKWRVVTRKGRTVTVLNENQIAALKGDSVQDKFVRLINAQEFEEGIQ